MVHDAFQIYPSFKHLSWSIAGSTGQKLGWMPVLLRANRHTHTLWAIQRQQLAHLHVIGLWEENEAAERECVQSIDTALTALPALLLHHHMQ